LAVENLYNYYFYKKLSKGWRFKAWYQHPEMLFP